MHPPTAQIWLHGVRVPRDALLDRFATVDAAGTYRSPIASPAARFGMVVSGCGGRGLQGAGMMQSPLPFGHAAGRASPMLHPRTPCAPCAPCAPCRSLTTGRMLIAQGAVDAIKIGVTIATRYSADRPQARHAWSGAGALALFWLGDAAGSPPAAHRLPLHPRPHPLPRSLVSARSCRT